MKTKYQIRRDGVGEAMYEADSALDALVRFACDQAAADVRTRAKAKGDRATATINGTEYEAVSARPVEATVAG